MSMDCVICYEKLTKNNCNCEKCQIFNNPDIPIITDTKINEHINKKEEYSFKCSTCNNVCCGVCFNKMYYRKNCSIVSCPICRQLAVKEYFKSNIMSHINTLGLLNKSKTKNKKMKRIIEKYSDTWKEGYWNDTGIPLLNKIVGIK